MSDEQPRLLITGAGGQLGRLVVTSLLERLPPARIVATVRSRADEQLAALGVEVRVADYDRPDTLLPAFAGIGRVLLISSNAVGRRVAQHARVIEAARRAGVRMLAYTSVLHADTSPLGLAEDHRQTEALLRASGMPFVLLRNGWYTENHTAGLAAALATGTLIGGAGAGRIASAARADYAAAAAAVLSAAEDGGDRVFELAGDTAYTLPELAAEVARRSRRRLDYVNLPEAEHRTALIDAGVPADLAKLIADSDAAASRGALFDDGRQLSALIGRSTEPMAKSVAEALGRP